MEAGRAAIWPRMEPFLLGALQVAPSSKLGLPYLRKMAIYVRTRDGCFPVLGWPRWKRIACGKLLLPEDVAWLYFETFDLLVDHHPQQRLEWAERLSQCSSKSELDHARNMLSVDTLQFLLFLYIRPLFLTLIPFGITACLNSGKKQIWAQQVEGAMKRAMIARNTHMAPAGSKMVLMSQVFKQTLAETSDKLTGASIKIHRCSEAFIYLLSPLRSVNVDKCRDSTVVLGPVQTSVHVHSCQNVRVVCVAGRVAIGASSHCTIHAMTPTRPLLLPGNTDITLGPFHTFYPSLEDHMASVGLAVVPNVWDQPLILGTDGLTSSSNNPPSSQDTAHKLLPPSEFHTLSVPFQMEGDTCEVPGGLPPAYQAALDEKQKRIQSWQKTVMEARLNKEQKRQFQELVELKFHEWLLDTGHRQELYSLIPPAVTSLEDPKEAATDTTRVKDRKHSRTASEEG
uniref:TBCC domain-containing protein 1 n=1 Tax=Nothobranchius korthausae TaxID=1143690 RepID=A0A1A8GMD7_9TELE